MMTVPPNKRHWIEPRAAMNVSSECGAVLALPVVAQHACLLSLASPSPAEHRSFLPRMARMGTDAEPDSLSVFIRVIRVYFPQHSLMGGDHSAIHRTRPNKPAAPNPAIASVLDSGHHRRGVGEPER